MKLLRFGAKGAEKPAILEAQGNIRDLSSVVADINGFVLEHELLKLVRPIWRLCRLYPMMCALARVWAMWANSSALA
nr:hypothetical protein [Alysiella crassa]